MAMISVQFEIFGKTIMRALDSDLQVRKNFKLKELANNKADQVVKLVVSERMFLFMDMIQELRDKTGKPINVSSWYRTKSYNQKIGGSRNSLHLDGLAMDFPMEVNENERKMMENRWRFICGKHGVVGGINHYTHGFHVCIGEEKFGNTEFTVRDYRGKKGDW